MNMTTKDTRGSLANIVGSLVLLLGAATILLVAIAPSRARAGFLATAPSGLQNASSAFSPDKGKFRIMVNGQQVGKEEFEIGPSSGAWVAHGTSQIQTPQGTSHVTGTLNIRPNGAPVRYEWSSEGAKKASATVAFSGANADIDLRLEGARPYTQQFTFNSPLVVILDDNLYHQYAILAHLYDWSKKGAQSFSVLVPQEMTPGTITVESLGKQPGAAGSADWEELRVKTEDNEIDVFLDGPKVMRLVAPSANAEIIRE
jgi:hypothetical protein